MRFLLFITLFVALTYSANGQTCNCESNFEWMKKTFEENDAGFQYIIDKKGQAAYDFHNQVMLEKIKSAKTLTECSGLLYEWLTFFRSGHIGIELLKNETPTPQNVPQTIQNTEMWNGNITKFEDYINAKKEPDYEGIWQIGVYKIGIQKEGANYVGFIIESGADTWTTGQVKLKIEQDGSTFKTTFYMRDHSPVESGKPEMLGNNYLQIGQQILKRISPAFSDDPSVENYFKSISSQNPYLEKLNETTLYLRIPSFDFSFKKDIDSVILANKSQILKTENLIIDLRNNGGGADDSFDELIPFLYTNPIRTVGVEFLSTKLNNERFLYYATTDEIDLGEETRKFMKESYEKMKNKMGEFVNLFGKDVSITQLDTVYKYPQKVGIIINKGNASTTEQFLLAAKQSKKVKLFGVTTGGALDISNLYEVESPCKEFKLHYCLSKSLRIPDMTIDGIGLQPDYYLDKTIPQYKWVEFVNGILNQ